MSASSSPASSQRSRSEDGSPTILTPTRKIKSILAQFDSDTESDNEKRLQTHANDSAPSHRNAENPCTTPSISASEDEVDDDDVLPIAPRGRLAARMRVQNTNNTVQDGSAGEDEDACDRVKKQSAQQADANEDSLAVAEEVSTMSNHSNAESPASGPLERRLLKRKITPAHERSPATQLSRSFSPLFFPSPSLHSQARQNESTMRSPNNATRDEGLVSASEQPNSRFLALVEKHRKERLAKETEVEAKRSRRMENLESLSNRKSGKRLSSADATEEDSDEEGRSAGKKLTQQSRPTRKASKKALEEMNRETQRMSRNMQLAHQARTKKKITKESLFAKFNYQQSETVAQAINVDTIASTTTSSAPVSDAEGGKLQSSPPTSPLQEDDSRDKALAGSMPFSGGLQAYVMEHVDDLPTVEDIMAQQVPPIDEGKGKTVVREPPVSGKSEKPKSRLTRPPIRIRWSKQDVVMQRGVDSDSDLEVVTAFDKTRKLAIFEKLPKRKAQETHSMLMLRSLAHLDASGKGHDNKRSSLTAIEMQASLIQQARLQAAKERAEKIQQLKDKGVFIETAEQRERDQAEVEDLVEKARQEAAEISKREKGAAKKDGTYEDDGLGNSSDEDDEDYNEEDEADAEASGSGEDNEEELEKERIDEEEGLEDDDDPKDAQGFVDEEASEQSTEERESENGNEAEDDVDDELRGDSETLPINRKPRVSRVISDDEDDEVKQQTFGEPQSVPRSARKIIIPGLPMSDDLPLGLTQAFEATMADSQSQTLDSNEDDSLTMLREMPEPVFQPMDLLPINSQEMVRDSQPDGPETVPLDVSLNFTQTQQSTPLTGASPRFGTSTQFSEVPEPSQDVGYVLSPFGERRFDTPAPHSTIDTVIIPRDDSPIVQRRGRLMRGPRAVAELSDDEDQNLAAEDIEPRVSAFDVMHRAARKPVSVDVFDKKKSNAREIVDEAAEESEDEYAGLGGASDDSAGEEDEEDRKMINDNSGEKVDERKLAALYA